MVLAILNRNPLYAIVLFEIIILVTRQARSGRASRLPFAPTRFVVFAIMSTSIFNGLNVHIGESVLFNLPEWLPLIGGAITAEAIVHGAIGGVTLGIVYAIFGVFNQVTSIHDLMRLTPRAFREAGVVVSIALTFVPQTTMSVRRIREAQAVRGHRIRGPGDWLPIFVPLVVGGLERSTNLAEAMVARGHGAVADQASGPGRQIGLIFGLGSLLVGWILVLLVPTWWAAGTAAMVIGAGAILSVVWLAGRGVHHTRYRARVWRMADTIVAIGAIVPLLVAVLPIPWIDRATLAYTTYPAIVFPGFDPFIGVSMLGLLTPAVIRLPVVDLDA